MSRRRGLARSRDRKFLKNQTFPLCRENYRFLLGWRQTSFSVVFRSAPTSINNSPVSSNEHPIRFANVCLFRHSQAPSSSSRRSNFLRRILFLVFRYEARSPSLPPRPLSVPLMSSPIPTITLCLEFPESYHKNPLVRAGINHGVTEAVHSIGKKNSTFQS